MSWQWDETLYAGSAAYYERGRLPYPQAVADTLRDELGLDGTGRLLDVGCGPGSLTLLLAPLFAEAVGIDADGDMVREAAQLGPANTRFVRLRAEELPAGLGTFRVATFAQSFHWMDQQIVAAAVHELLEPGGAVAQTGGPQDIQSDAPRREIDRLVKAYLGPVRRAGRGSLPRGTARWEDDAFRAAGFRGPRNLEVEGGEMHERSEDDIVASVYSLSSAAPHLFGDRLGEFESDLRALLRRASRDGRFRERPGKVGLKIWRR